MIQTTFCCKCSKKLGKNYVVVKAYCPYCGVEVKNFYCKECVEKLTAEILEKIAKLPLKLRG